MKILIIDDSRTMRRLLSSFLAPLTENIAEAGDGQAALTVLGQEAPFDLALVDWDMPIMNGLDFVKTVRADSRYADMKLMMVTAQNGFDTVSQAIEAGADDYLMKPLTEEMLFDKLRVLGMAE
jgi:two-component system chemotaxis response regulator CheY